MQCKKIFDGRCLPRDAKEQLRIAAVRRVIAGKSPESVANGMGRNRRTIYGWLEAHHYGGEDALKAKPIPGAPPKISARQMEVLARIVREKSCPCSKNLSALGNGLLMKIATDAFLMSRIEHCRKLRSGVCVENLIHVDVATKSAKLAR